MHEITLYTLNARTVISHDSGTIAYYHALLSPDPRTKVLPDAAITAQYKIDHLPVHWFRERHSDGNEQDYRFAIEPKLMTMLESVAEEKFSKKLQNKISELSTTNQRLADISQSYRQQVKDFKAKPWYKRIWIAIKNNI